jgi:hypothetical protein
MRRDPRVMLTGALHGLLASSAAPLVLGCDSDATVLVRASGAGGGGLTDAGVGGGGGQGGGGSVTDLDASQSAPIEIRGSGFSKYAGRTIYGHIGPLSDVVVSTTIEPDGTFVLAFPKVLVILGQAYLETYVDLDDDGQCHALDDELGWTNIHLVQSGEGLVAALALDDLSTPLLGCGGLY